MAMIIPKSGVSLGVINEDGNWVDKSDMIYVDEDTNEAVAVPSSFDEEKRY